MLKLKDSNITGDQYINFLHLCFEISDEFSLTKVPQINSNFKTIDLHSQLEPYCLKEIVTNHWYHFYTPEYPLTRYIYDANPSAFQVISKLFDNIFFIASDDQTMSNLEDICFFSENKLIVGTVSHEYECLVFNKNCEGLNKVHRFSRWEQQVYFERRKDDYIYFSNDYFIIED